MTRRVMVACIFLAVSSITRPAYADLTAFIGVNPTPTNRPVRGFAGGISLVIFGLEFEYSDSVEDIVEGAPSLRTGTGNIYLQTPIPVHGFQFYGITGAGIYHERLGDIAETHVTANIGGGVRIGLAGPLRLRIDYRVFTLRGQPLHARPQRLYAGLNLVF